MKMTAETNASVNTTSLLGELFLFEGHAVRVVGSAENPLFVATDVCEVLGITKHRDALQRVPAWGRGPLWKEASTQTGRFRDSETRKGVDNSDTLSDQDSEITRSLGDDEKGITTSDTLGGRGSFATLTEGGLYFLVLRSDKPAAVEFHHWVCAKVLPEIRKHGFYAREGMDARLARIERAKGLRARRQSLLAEAKALATEIARLEDLGSDAASVAEVLGTAHAPLATINRCLSFARRNAVPVGRRDGHTILPRAAIIAALGLDQSNLPLN